MSRYWVEAFYATERPPTDQDSRIIMVDEPDDTAACLTAALWVAGKRGTVMPTRTTILQVEM